MLGERERRNPLTSGGGTSQGITGPVKARVIAGNVTTD